MTDRGHRSVARFDDNCELALKRGMTDDRASARLAVVMDPIETSSRRRTSTLAMMLAAQRARLGARCTSDQHDLWLRDGAPLGAGAPRRGPRRPRRLVHARRALDRRLERLRRDPDAQGPAVRHGVHLHDLHPRARRACRALLVVNRPSGPAGHEREGVHGVVPGVLPPTLVTRIAQRAARVPGRARPDRAEAARRHGRALDLRRRAPAT